MTTEFADQVDKFTNDDVTRLAEMLTEIGWEVGWVYAVYAVARRLLEQGVTLPPPPPDPAVVVAMWLTGRSHPAEEYLARMRDLFTTDAIEAAAAKIVTGGGASATGQSQHDGSFKRSASTAQHAPSGDTAAAKVQEAES